MPSVAIIIPAYNAAKYIRQTLSSVLNSNYRDFEVVVVDDGSTDSTAAIADNFDDSRIRVLSRPNSGMSASRNLGIRSTDSEFVALLDSDDLWHPEKLGLQLKVLAENVQYGLCFSEFLQWAGGDTGGFEGSAVSAALNLQLTGWTYHRMLLTNWVMPSSVVFRRTLWNELGEFLCEDQQTDDWEYFVRASRRFQFAKLRDPLVLYRQHQASLSKRLSAENKQEVMRDRLLRAYGMTSPQGIPVDEDELAIRRYISRRHFADTHLARGDLVIGMKRIWELILSGPRRLVTIEIGIKAIGKRVLSRSRT